MAKRVLLVEPDQDIRERLTGVLNDAAVMTVVADFHSARAAVQIAPVDLIVTNLRLQAYNGIHLAVCAGPRCVVYADAHDMMLARDAQAVGAFYERLDRMPFVLPSYLRTTLPSRDRRTLVVQDRRQWFRGGRRAGDVPEVYANVVWSDRFPGILN